MNITINTDVLQRRNLSLEEFLVLLAEYYNINLKDTINHLILKKIVEKSNHPSSLVVLSNNSRNLVAQILVESNSKVINSPLDFNALALKLQSLYPEGIKPSTTYSWRGNTEDIAFKLRVLVAQYDFAFTEQEAIDATKEYLNSYKDSKYLQLLPYFILKTAKDGEISSLFMTLIENSRQNENNN